MKKQYFLQLTALLLCLTFNTYGQNDNSNVNMNLLAAPSTAAATMLGFSPSEVDKPREASEFTASIVNNTDGYSRWPANYAVEIAPAWFFTGHKIGFNDFSSNKVDKNLWQSLSISAAVRRSGPAADTLGPLTQVAFGLKTSILRGHRFHSAVQEKIDRSREVLRRINGGLSEYLDSDSLLNVYLEEFDTAAYNSRRAELTANFGNAKSDELAQFQADVQDLRFDRVGFKLDLTAGIVQDFPGGGFDDQRISKIGVWLSGGYEWEGGFSFLGILRYLQNPDAEYSDDDERLLVGDVRSFDGGFRLVYAPIARPFTLSAEGIYRSSIEPEVLPSNWRLAINAEYKIKPNMSLNFSYGRDFDGTVTRDGNVIALLSMFTSFGNSKPLDDKPKEGN